MRVYSLIIFFLIASRIQTSLIAQAVNQMQLEDSLRRELRILPIEADILHLKEDIAKSNQECQKKLEIYMSEEQSKIDFHMAFLQIFIGLLAIVSVIFTFSYRKEMKDDMKEIRNSTSADKLEIREMKKEIMQMNSEAELILEKMRAYERESKSNPHKEIQELAIEGRVENQSAVDVAKLTILEEKVRAYEGEDSFYELLLLRGIRHNQNKEWSLAIDCLSLYIKGKPQEHAAYFQRCWAYDESSMLMLALSDIEDAILLIPSEAEYHFIHGWILQELERIDESMEAYDRALKLEPNNYQVLNNYGWLLLQTSRWKEGAGMIRKGFEIKPDYALIIDSMGSVLEREGDEIISTDHSLAQNKYNEAKKLYNRALELRPEDEYAKHNSKNIEAKIDA